MTDVKISPVNEDSLRIFAESVGVDPEKLVRSVQLISETRKYIYTLVQESQELIEINEALRLYLFMLGLASTICTAPSPDYPEQTAQYMLMMCEAMGREFGSDMPSQDLESLTNTGS